MLPNHSEGTEIAKPQLVDSSPSPTSTKASPPAVPGPAKSPPTTTKGFGLKKWRRIRREITKDSTTNPDLTKMLKRGSANIVDVKQPGDGGDSISSTIAFVQSLGVSDHFGTGGSSSSYRLTADTIFTAGVDSDNSDDRSSRSSTAASAPKSRHDTLRALGHQREKARVKNLSGRNLSAIGLAPRFQAGKGLVETSKKFRGESISLQKENSLSSMESDSRSCSSMFVKGVSSAVNDRAQNGIPINSDGENTYDEPAFEEQYTEGLQACCGNNVSLSQDNSCGAKNGNSKNLQLPRDGDPLVKSFRMLQSAQVALEREVQRFGEVGKGFRFLSADLSETTGDPAYSMTLSNEAFTDFPLDGWASDFNRAYVNKNVQELERRLSEAEVKLKEKELKIVELEATLKTMEPHHRSKKTMEPHQEDIWSNTELHVKRRQDVEAVLDGLFKQKVETEVQYLAITASTEELNILVKDQIELLIEQKSRAMEQAQSLGKMTDVDNNTVMQGRQPEQLDTPRREIASGEEILKMQRRVVKFTKCFFIQLVLLALVCGLFVLQLLPKSTVVVPT